MGVILKIEKKILDFEKGWWYDRGMRKILPLPDEEKFFIELHSLTSIDQLGEWVDNPQEKKYGVFCPNDFDEHNYFCVGRIFVLTDSLHPISLSGLSVEAAMGYATLISSFAEFKSGVDLAEFLRQCVVNSTKFIMAQLLEPEQPDYVY